MLARRAAKPRTPFAGPPTPPPVATLPSTAGAASALVEGDGTATAAGKSPTRHGHAHDTPPPAPESTPARRRTRSSVGNGAASAQDAALPRPSTATSVVVSGLQRSTSDSSGGGGSSGSLPEKAMQPGMGNGLSSMLRNAPLRVQGLRMSSAAVSTVSHSTGVTVAVPAAMARNVRATEIFRRSSSDAASPPRAVASAAVAVPAQGSATFTRVIAAQTTAVEGPAPPLPPPLAGANSDASVAGAPARAPALRATAYFRKVHSPVAPPPAPGARLAPTLDDAGTSDPPAGDAVSAERGPTVVVRASGLPPLAPPIAAAVPTNALGIPHQHAAATAGSAGRLSSGGDDTFVVAETPQRAGDATTRCPDGEGAPSPTTALYVGPTPFQRELEYDRALHADAGFTQAACGATNLRTVVLAGGATAGAEGRFSTIDGRRLDVAFLMSGASPEKAHSSPLAVGGLTPTTVRPGATAVVGTTPIPVEGAADAAVAPLVHPRNHPAADGDDDGPPPPRELMDEQVHEDFDPADLGPMSVSQMMHNDTAPREQQSDSNALDAAARARAQAAADDADGLGPRPTDSFYGLPLLAQTVYKTRGVTRLHEWQDRVLRRRDVAAFKNFVYSLPTSGGKTLVAEVLLMRAILQRRRSAMFVVPYVAIAEEKVAAMQNLATSLGFQLEGYFGSTGRFPPSQLPTAWICTIEKGTSLLHHLIEEGRAHELGCVVVDELHMVGDGRRGVILELLLSTIVCALPDVQVVGMSATVPNLPVLAQWLKAECYICDYRPVPLRQHVVVQNFVYEEDCATVARKLPETLSTDDERVSHLVMEAVQDGHSVLVFCATRPQTIDMARKLSLHLQRMEQQKMRQKAAAALLAASTAANSPPTRTRFGGGGGGLAPGAAPSAAPAGPSAEEIAEAARQQKEKERAELRQNVVKKIKDLQSTEAAPMCDTVMQGIAFHHGGLAMEEREVVEQAFKSRTVLCLCCTSTLAAGVNLPARRVIFRTPFIARDFLTKSRYLQMCGRAGRAGLDDFGESYLLLSLNDRRRGLELVRKESEAIESALLTADGPHGLARAILQAVSLRITTQEAGLRKFTERLFCAYTAPTLLDVERREDELKQAMAYLTSSGLLESVRPTQLSSVLLTPSDGGSPASQSTQSRRQARRAAAAATTSTEMAPLAARSSSSGSLQAGSLADLSGTATGANARTLRATPFGASSVKALFSIEDAMRIRQELESMQQTGLILADGDLHVCYFLTPVKDTSDTNWQILQHMVSRMPPVRQRTVQLLGVSEAFVDRKASGFPTPDNEDTRRATYACRRLYNALMLCELLNEMPAMDVSQRFSVQRGAVTTLLKNAGTFAGAITSFCNAMGWFSLEAVLSSFVKRIGYGVKPDLFPLMEIADVKPPRARILWSAGFKSPEQLATMSPEELLRRVKGSPKLRDNRAVKFFTIRSAQSIVRNAHLLVQSKIKSKHEELIELEHAAADLPAAPSPVAASTPRRSTFVGGTAAITGAAPGASSPSAGPRRLRMADTPPQHSRAAHVEPSAAPAAPAPAAGTRRERDTTPPRHAAGGPEPAPSGLPQPAPASSSSGQTAPEGDAVASGAGAPPAASATCAVVDGPVAGVVPQLVGPGLSSRTVARTKFTGLP